MLIANKRARRGGSHAERVYRGCQETWLRAVASGQRAAQELLITALLHGTTAESLKPIAQHGSIDFQRSRCSVGFLCSSGRGCSDCVFDSMNIARAAFEIG
jgi:hypothetical protein